MSDENSAHTTPGDPRELIRAHILHLEAKAEDLSSELAGVKAELKQYRTALSALEEKPAKQTVNREVVRGEVIAYLTAAPEHTASRKDLDSALKAKLKGEGYKLNGFARRVEEVLGDESTFTIHGRSKVSLSSSSS